MNALKRFISMALFIVGTVWTSWAQDIETTLVADDDGYYQIASAADWQELSRIVAAYNGSIINARMTADINLGESQAMLGDSEHEDRPTYYYQGTFDGQGHTLTVHYTGTSQTAASSRLWIPTPKPPPTYATEP